MTETTQLQRKPGSKYSTEQIEQGIQALALYNGSDYAAARFLAEQGLEIPRETLRGWKRLYAKHLEVTEKRVEEQIYRKTARKFRRIVDEAQDVTLNALDAAQKAIDADDPKTASAWSNTAKSTAIVTGIGTEKAAGIDGRPMVHHDAKGLTELLRSLERHPGIAKVNWDVVDSEAKDVTPEPQQLASSAPSSAPRGLHTPQQKDPELAG